MTSAAKNDSPPPCNKVISSYVKVKREQKVISKNGNVGSSGDNFVTNALVGLAVEGGTHAKAFKEI